MPLGLCREVDGRPATAATTPADRLRTTMAACRVQFTWLGTSKALTAAQRAQAAEAFDAEGQFLSAGKKLLDVKHPAFRAVTAIRGKIQAYARGMSRWSLRYRSAALPSMPRSRDTSEAGYAGPTKPM